MFDVGWSELFVVGVVALVVVGPKDLPKLMRSAGQWAGRARSMADQFRRSFDDMARQAELDELRQEVSRMKSDKVIDDILKDTTIAPPELQKLQAEMRQAGTPPVFEPSPPAQVPAAPAPQGGSADTVSNSPAKS